MAADDQLDELYDFVTRMTAAHLRAAQARGDERSVEVLRSHLRTFDRVYASTKASLNRREGAVLYFRKRAVAYRGHPDWQPAWKLGAS